MKNLPSLRVELLLNFAVLAAAALVIAIGAVVFLSMVQAEDATIGGGSIVETNNAGFNGTGFVNLPTSGGFVQFNNVDGGSGGSSVGDTTGNMFDLPVTSATTHASRGGVTVRTVSKSVP